MAKFATSTPVGTLSTDVRPQSCEGVADAQALTWAGSPGWR